MGIVRVLCAKYIIKAIPSWKMFSKIFNQLHKIKICQDENSLQVRFKNDSIIQTKQ